MADGKKLGSRSFSGGFTSTGSSRSRTSTLSSSQSIIPRDHENTDSHGSLLLPQNQAVLSSVVSVFILLGGLIAPAAFQGFYTADFPCSTLQDPDQQAQCAACAADYRTILALAFLLAVVSILLSGMLLSMLSWYGSPARGYAKESRLMFNAYMGISNIMKCSMAGAIVCWFASFVLAQRCLVAAPDAHSHAIIAAAAFCVLVVFGALGITAWVKARHSKQPNHYRINAAVFAQVIMHKCNSAKESEQGSGLRLNFFEVLEQCQVVYRLHNPDGPLPAAFISMRAFCEELSNWVPGHIHAVEWLPCCDVDKAEALDVHCMECVRNLARVVLGNPWDDSWLCDWRCEFCLNNMHMCPMATSKMV